MNTVFIVLMLIAMVATLIALVAGLFGMAKGGEFNEKYGNKLMKARVALQGLALLFFVGALLTSGG